MSKRKYSDLVHGHSDVEIDVGRNFSNLEDLPKEIMFEILSRLAPDSLMRCKSLNKSWYFTIKCLVTDPDFVAKHLRCSEADPETLLLCGHERQTLFKPPEKNPGLPESFLQEFITSMAVSRFVEDERGFGCASVEVVKLPQLLFGSNMYRMEAYYCNGVICVTNDFRTLTLCNPSLRELEVFRPWADHDLGGYEIEVVGMGIGSDLKASIYKIVRFLSPMRVEVFTLGTSHDCWREVDICIGAEQYGRVEDHVYFRGSCFWLMRGAPKTVLCFDVSGETFRAVPLPDELRGPGEEKCPMLAFYKDSVCLFSYRYEEPVEEPLEVWTMDFVGDAGPGDRGCSWRKWLRIEPIGIFRRPYTFWKSDELIVEKDDEDDFLSYNIRTRELRNFVGIDMLGLIIFFFGFFVKSLVSIKRMKRV